jgi:hypothetical protein
MTKSRFYLPIAALILTATLAVPAAAQNQVPFKGSLQGQETDTPQGGPPPHHTEREREYHRNCYPCRSIHIHL